MTLSELQTDSLWPPILLGLLAVYMLLPRPSAFPRLAGIIAGIAALVFGGLALVPEAAKASVVEAILFYSFSALALIGGLILVTQSKPARGAVAFALVVLSSCGLYLLQAAPFLMAGTIIIYAGAIVVTFLFVIMLSHQHGPSNADERSREPLMSCLAGGLLLAALLLVFRNHYDDGGIRQVSMAAQSLATGKGDVRELREAINRLRPNSDAVKIKSEFEAMEPRLTNQSMTQEETANAIQAFAQRVDGLRKHLGAMPPDERVNLSSFAGIPSNKQDAGGLPAANVVGLGRTIYSDYLLGVEMAGALLLVATLGAIAITNRHPTRRAA